MRLEEGIEKSDVPYSIDIESSWQNPTLDEVVICMKNSANNKDKKREHFTLNIPENLINQGGSDKIKYEKWQVLELMPKEEQHWWNGKVRARNDVQVYGLTILVEYGCNEPKSNWTKLPLLRTNTDILAKDALLFKGETLSQIVTKKQPFLIFAPLELSRTRIDEDIAATPQLSVCSKILNAPCILIVTKPQIMDTEYGNKIHSEILIPDKLVWVSNPEPLWYLAMPFAIVADVVIVLAAILVLGAKGCC